MRTYQKKIGLLLCCAFAVTSRAQTPPNFTIRGAFEGMTALPAKVYLIYPGYLQQTDSAVVTFGNYTLSGYTANMVGAELSLSRAVNNRQPQSHFTLVLAPGEITVVSTGSFDRFTATGSGAGPQQELEAILQPNQLAIAALHQAMTSERYQTDPAYKKTLVVKNYALIKQNMQLLNAYAQTHPKSEITPYLTYVRLASGLNRDTLSVHLEPAVLPTPLGREIERLVALQKNKTPDIAPARDKAPVPGDRAKEFTLNDTRGRPVSLASFKGRYVLLDFWASWCAPCRAESPNLIRAYAAYKAKGFAILGVSLDAEPQKAAWLAAIKKDRLTWTQVGDGKGWFNTAAQLYGVTSLPQNFLIDPQGTIIAKDLHGMALQQKLASLFNK